MRGFHHARPASVAEAIDAFSAAGPEARYIAGGTTLFDMMKLGIEQPTHLIDVTGIAGLDAIETDGACLRLGAMASMSAVARDPVVASAYPVLAEALHKAASQQLRNMATVGGNLLQRTRCMYFRNGTGGVSTVGSYPCNKRAPGSGCAARDGLDRGQAVLGQSDACNAVSPGDWPVALTALDATIEIEGPAGKRAIPIDALYRLPDATPHLEFTLAPGELITAIVVPKSEAGRRSTYHKIRDRESFAFALVSAAVALEMAGDRIAAAHIALGGIATKPWRARAAEALLVGQALSEERALTAGCAAVAEARAGHENAFKIELAARTVAEALHIAAERSAT